MIPKTEIVKTLVAQGDWKAALKIASRFKVLTKSDKADLVRAFECYNYPDFYIQLGFNPEQVKEQGVNVLKKLWG